MRDLTDREQRSVRTALHVLRNRVGAWAPLAKELGYQPDSLHKVAMAKRAVAPALVLRVARFAKVPVDDLLAGRWLPVGICGHCGRNPADNVDARAVSPEGQRRIARAAANEHELTAAEQRAVRTALRFLRRQVGGWEPLGRALDCDDGAIRKVAVGMRVVTPAIAMSVARLAQVSMEDLLGGQWLSPRVCPHCGRPPSDFGDEDTIVA